jgi:GT2 family glycosyltransferase
MKLGIIILNWNNFTETKKCINSILDAKIDKTIIDYEIFLIDNNSADMSGSKLQEYFLKKVSYYNTGNNKGYTGGNNFGIQKAIEKDCDYILILNNDLYIENFKFMIDSIFKVMAFDKKIGIIGFDIYNYETKDKINTENKSDTIFNKLFNKLLNISNTKDMVTKDIDIISKRTVCGCAMCLTKDCINNIGYFDESFFMYAEEHDITLRAIKDKWKVKKIINNKFKIFRKIDPISSNQLIWYYGTRNIFYAYFNNLTTFNKIIFFNIQIAIYLKQIIKFCLNGDNIISKKMIKGIVHFLINKKGKLSEN